MGLIQTIHGFVDETTLARTVLFEDRPKEFVISVEWRRPHASPLPALKENATTDEQLVYARESQGELVKRDCHIILKTPSVTADAIASSLG